MKPDNLTLNKLNMNHTLNIEVKVSKVLKFRLFIATVLFYLGGLILGCNVKMIHKHSEEK